MGFNTTVVVLNDALDQIEKDPEFGKNLGNAIRRLTVNPNGIDIPAGCHCNAAHVVETHHADFATVVAVGGNYGVMLSSSWLQNKPLDDKESKILMLKNLAAELGFTVRKMKRKS